MFIVMEGFETDTSIHHSNQSMALYNYICLLRTYIRISMFIRVYMFIFMHDLRLTPDPK